MHHIVGDACSGVDPVVDSQEKAELQRVAHCARRGDKHLTWKRMVREVEDGKVNGGVD